MRQLQQEKPKPVPLNIDVDQWRRDINTFSSTTKQALEGIVSDLSSQCSGIGQESEANASRPSNRIDSKDVTTESFQGSLPEENNAGDYSRFEKLKAQLAKRLEKTS